MLSNQNTIIKNIWQLFTGLLFVYLLGFMFVFAAFMTGSDGEDLLSQHYRGTIAALIN